VSNTRQSYPKAAFGHMDDEIRLGYQAGVVSLVSPTYGSRYRFQTRPPLRFSLLLENQDLFRSVVCSKSEIASPPTVLGSSDFSGGHRRRFLIGGAVAQSFDFGSTLRWLIALVLLKGLSLRKRRSFIIISIF
jgi:hypothetical protein